MVKWLELFHILLVEWLELFHILLVEWLELFHILLVEWCKVIGKTFKFLHGLLLGPLLCYFELIRECKIIEWFFSLLFLRYFLYAKVIPIVFLVNNFLMAKCFIDGGVKLFYIYLLLC